MAVKSAEEISLIEASCRITQDSLYAALGAVREGIAERELAAEIEYQMKKRGATKTSFDLIVAFGENAAVPHHETGDRKLGKNECVLTDIGCVYRGYCSDMTRTVFYGEPTEEFSSAYEAVLGSALAAERNIRPGMTGVRADAFARDYLAGRGLAAYFTHSLGHGVGVNIHEAPYLSPKRENILRDNMVFSIEPGVYLDSKKYMRDTLKLFDGIRAKEGFDIDLVHDVHERIHPTEAVTFVKEMEPYKLFFMEDVVPLEQVEWLDKIKQTSVTPLSQGELFNNPAEYKKLVQNRSIDYMRVHLSQVGGITPARKLQMFCEQYGVRICWHGPGDMSPLAHAANIHIDLAAQNLGLQEWSGIEPPNFVIQKLKDNHGALLEVFPGMPEYGNDGFVYANDKPGLGVDLNEKEAAKYPCENTVTTWTQTRNRDGSLQTP